MWRGNKSSASEDSASPRQLMRDEPVDKDFQCNKASVRSGVPASHGAFVFLPCQADAVSNVLPSVLCPFLSMNRKGSGNTDTNNIGLC